MNKPNIPIPVAVDPLSLLLPEHIYVKIIEWLHPHVPSVEAVERAVAMMSAEDKAYTLSRVKQVKEYVDAVEKVVEKAAR